MKKVEIGLIVLAVFGIFSLSIAYSAFGSDLSISGEAVVAVDNDIRVTENNFVSATNDAYQKYNPKYTNYTVSMFPVVSGDSQIIYEVTITNNSEDAYLFDGYNLFSSSYDYEDEDGNIITISDTSDVLTITLDGIEEYERIDPESSITFNVILDISNLDLEDSEAEFSLMIEFSWELYADPMSLVDYITLLYDNGDSSLAYDGTADDNLRYYGSNPDNYIDIGDRDDDGNVILWRIIGVMNNVDDGEGNLESRVKIIRSSSIGAIAYSSSNNNNWASASLMTYLNSGDYYESLSDETKSYFGDAVWHLGGASSTNFTSSIPSKAYSYERGTTVYSGHPTTWTGEVALMYASDWCFATGGNSLTSRSTCLNTKLKNYSNNSGCYTGDWLHLGGSERTLNPLSSAVGLLAYVYGGYITYANVATSTMATRPSVYLLSNVYTVGWSLGDEVGTSSNPIRIQLIEKDEDKTPEDDENLGDDIDENSTEDQDENADENNGENSETSEETDTD